jgi:hypothetical protein
MIFPATTHSATIFIGETSGATKKPSAISPEMNGIDA